MLHREYGLNRAGGCVVDPEWSERLKHRLQKKLLVRRLVRLLVYRAGDPDRQTTVNDPA